MKRWCLIVIVFLALASIVSAQTVSTAELKSVLIDSIKDYLSSQTPKLEKAELKDLIVVYLSTKGDTADLSGNGPFSGKKLFDVYNKAKGITTQTSFVHSLYVDLLHRDPSDSEVAWWVNYMKQNNLTQKQMMEAFMASDEYKLLHPSPIQGIVLPWGLISTNPASRLSFGAGETKTFIARITSNCRGFDVIYTPMGGIPSGDFRVTAKMQIPLKPDGTKYSIPATIEERLTSGVMWASYDGSIDFKIRTDTVILDPFVYPGDFIITMTADRAGWGFLNTELHPAADNPSGEVLPWGLKASVLNFRAGETKTYIARVTDNNVKGFSIGIYPMSDGTITTKIIVPPGTPTKGDFWHHEATGDWYSRSGGYDSTSGVGLTGLKWGGPTTASLASDYVPIGDYLITISSDIGGWGYLYTPLFT